MRRPSGFLYARQTAWRRRHGITQESAAREKNIISVVVVAAAAAGRVGVVAEEGKTATENRSVRTGRWIEEDGEEREKIRAAEKKQKKNNIIERRGVFAGRGAS